MKRFILPALLALVPTFLPALFFPATAKVNRPTATPITCTHIQDTSCDGAVTVDCSPVPCPKQVGCYRVVKTAANEYRIDVRLRDKNPFNKIEFIKMQNPTCRDKIAIVSGATFIDDEFWDETTGADLTGQWWFTHYGSVFFSFTSEPGAKDVTISFEFTHSEDQGAGFVQIAKYKRFANLKFTADTSTSGLPRVIPHQNVVFECRSCCCNPIQCSDFCSAEPFVIAP